MCGILGFTGKKDLTQLAQGLMRIDHRGRDGKVQMFFGGMNLGMNRLAINDLTTNLYPMKYKHYELIINGEIYNYPQLRKKLKKLGYNCKTRCDAEVVLPFYHVYGIKAFSLLEGMFAVAIIDRKKNQLVLARDKFGEKPLYYSYKEKKFLSFASELKLILALSKNNLLEKKSLYSYLRHGSVFGRFTLIKDVFKLLPGECLFFDLNKKEMSRQQYWRPKFMENKPAKPTAVIEQLDTQLKRSVSQRLLSDVPVGAFLSGGVDSSLITALAVKQVKQMHTYSVSFPDQPRYNEALFSNKVAEYLGTKHTIVNCTQTAVMEVINQIGSMIDEPISDPAVLPTFLMAREARKSVKVVLTGEGADELFGGYYRYKKYLFHQKWHDHNLYQNSKKIRDVLFPNRLKRIYETGYETYSPQNIWIEEEIQKLLAPLEVIKDESVDGSNSLTLLQQLQLQDIHGYLANQLLMKVDKFTMLHNLEARAPYLDTQISHIGLNLPDTQKIRGVHTKYILRKVAEKHLPKYIAWRWKQGFSLPLDTWYRQDLKEFVYHSLDLAKKYEHIFDADLYKRVIKEHLSEQANFRDKIWSMSVLLYWLDANKISTS